MLLTAGTRLGSYEIISALGAGGMGEVYRARDTRLDRNVALKILPEAFATDVERVARFKREAKVLASLNHPHIAAIYGLEDTEGVRALVMELVEGEDLAQRLARGAIALDEALPIANQIAEALEAAHEQGIIHRDLKPANIKITPDGVVKVLDFGLAKLVPSEASGGFAEVTASPTITSPGKMTGVGVLLGTAAYMAPEQAKGRNADKRSDVWAFGCVLYEMLTGRRAFDGDDMTEVLGAVVRLEPNWEAISSDVPPAIRTLVQQCLVKERRTRIGDIAAALFVINHQARFSATSMASAPLVPRGRLWRRVAALAGGALTVAAIATTFTWFVMRPMPSRVMRTTITTSGSAALALQGGDRDIAITPDGSRVVYRGSNQLLVRSLNQLEPTVLSGLSSPRGVFISPDGQLVGFFDGTTLKKVAITGGPSVTLCTVENSPRGATWSEDGTIIFATNATGTGLHRVSSAGGEPTLLTKPDREHGEDDHLWPEFLPGGNAVLFTITPRHGGIENAQIAVLDLRTGKSKVLIRGGSHAIFVPTGHLVYGVMGTLRAVVFDLRRLEVVGTPAPVLDGVVTKASGAADIGVAANGSLVYVRGGAGGAAQQSVVSLDRQGNASPLAGVPLDSYRDIRLSPDGARIALATQADVLTYDVARATLSRLTTNPAPDHSPLWTPDGQRIIFTSTRAGYPELFWRPADGSGSDEPLVARSKDLVDLVASTWSADGRQLLFGEVPPNIKGAIGQIAIAHPSDAKVLVTSAFNNNAFPAVSPDGRWLAYQASTVSGRSEIYVEKYPDLGNRQQISTAGGRLPLWSRDGRELFFSSLDGRQMLAVAVQSGTTLAAGRPQKLFDVVMLVQGNGNRPYDIAPDGRFLIIRSGQEDSGGTVSNMIVVQNWLEELKRLVPAK